MTRDRRVAVHRRMICGLDYIRWPYDNRAHSPTFPSLHLRHSSFSNPSVASSTSQLILQPFFRFSYVTGSSLTSPGETPMGWGKIQEKKPQSGNWPDRGSNSGTLYVLLDHSGGHLIWNFVCSLDWKSRYAVESGPGGASGKALGYGLDGPGSIPGVGGVEIFLHSFVSRLVLGSTQLPIKWLPGNFSGGKGGRA